MGRAWFLVVTAIVAILVVIAVLAVWFLYWASPPAPNRPDCGLSGCSPVFAVGPATEQSYGGGYWYNFSVTSASGGLTWQNLQIEVQTPGGGSVTPTSQWAVQINQSHSITVAVYNPSNGGWSNAGGVPIRNDQEIVLFTGVTNLSAQGYSLVLLGVGAFSGSVSASIP